jgi:hypothetical protein
MVMALEVNPAIVIGIGSLAERIINRTQELLRQSNHFDSIPSIFQFLVLDEDRTDAEEVIVEAYNVTLNKRAHFQTQQDTGMTVSTSRVESFIIASLQAEHYEATVQAAYTLKGYAKQTIAGGRNAIFLLPRRVLASDLKSLQTTAEALDAEIKTHAPFNRCFFIEEVDEAGQAIVEDELIELVARFISLAIASELSGPLRTVPPPYFGTGSHHQGYASFSCSTIGFNACRFIDVLSHYLASDICQRVFGSQSVKYNESTWPEQARHWFKESLRKPLNDPTSTDFTDVTQDADFIDAKERLDEFMRSAGEALSHNMQDYQSLIDECLKQGVIQLESHAQKMKNIKREINRLEIKIMLNKPCGSEPQRIEKQIKVRQWPLITVLGIFGLGLIAYTLFSTNGQLPLPLDKLLTVLGVISVGAAIALMIVGSKRDASETIVTTVSCEEELRKKKEYYEQERKLQNIHVALFSYLDLAYANLEDLHRRIIAPDTKSTCSIFDVDLIDNELAKKFYDQYGNRDAHITAFGKGPYFQEVHQSMFSFFNVKLFDYLRQYCNNCFEDVRGYDFEQVFRLRESLNGYKELQTISPPFWRPRNPKDSEKVVLAVLHEHFLNSMRTLLSNTFGTHNIRFFDGRKSTTTTLVQVAYGQPLKDIIGYLPSDSVET